MVWHHTSIAYGGSGSWYWREWPASDAPSSLALSFFTAFDQAWFMGLFFLLAGAFTGPALHAKGPARYLRDRLLRLGLPLLLYGVVIGPATIALAQTARGRAFGDTLSVLWQRGHFEAGPLWFAWALLLMAAAALAWHRVRPLPAGARAWPPDAVLLTAALGTAAAAFVLRLVWPVGVDVWALQLGYFAGYTVLFAFGCAMTADGLLALPPGRVRRWRSVAWLALPLLPLVVLAGLPGRPEGGASLPALAYALWEPLVAGGVIGTLLVRAARPAAPSPLWALLSRRAFAVYVVHPPVVVAVTLALHGWAAPPLAKFALAGSMACVLCVVLAGLLLRVPGLRRVF